MFTLDDILHGNAGKVHIHSTVSPSSTITFRAARHDSRQIAPGDLFVALPGEHVDGHHFIGAAARAGAIAALCSHPASDVPTNFLQIMVPDVLAALQATARTRTRRQEHTTLIGITGSNGKTGTKDAVAAVLSSRAPTLKTQASYNHEIGYPLTLLRLEPRHRYAVLEMGAQWVGELAWLSNTIACPHQSIITNVGASHLAHFGSQAKVAIAKAELVEVLSPEGIAMLNYDDENVRAMASKTRAHVLYYGLGEDASVRASNLAGDILSGYSFTLSYRQQSRAIQLRLPGEHGVTIALAAAAAGCAADMSLDEIGPVLETLTPTKGRCELQPGPNGSTLIDDTYNANRQSIIAICKAMHDSTHSQHGKRWAVLGDIFELGTFTHTEHVSTGMALAGKIDILVAIGDAARFYVEGAIQAGMPRKNVYYFRANINNHTELEAAKQTAADLLRQKVRPEDLVLIKGSRGMRMESMLPMLHEKNT